jgi:hypothetical protein
MGPELLWRDGQSGKRVGLAWVCAFYYLPHCHMKQGCQMSKYPTGYCNYYSLSVGESQQKLSTIDGIKKLLFKPCLDWQRLHHNAGNSDTHYWLALATLGGTTEIEKILIAKVSKEGDIVTLYLRCFHVQISPM